METQQFEVTEKKSRSAINHKVLTACYRACCKKGGMTRQNVYDAYMKSGGDGHGSPSSIMSAISNATGVGYRFAVQSGIVDDVTVKVTENNGYESKNVRLADIAKVLKWGELVDAGRSVETFDEEQLEEIEVTF